MCTRIPKTIHYCWFGGNELPSLTRRCIESWKRYCKDYEIIRWDESNFSIDEAPEYVRQAYAARKWAFVSDYVRLFVLYRYGGVYMDADLEVIRPIDRFLEHGAFSGFEDETSIPTGIMGSEPGNPWIGMLLEDYDHRSFVNPDGSFDYTTNVRVITRLTVERYGLVRNNTLQKLADGVVLYPNWYFCPKSLGLEELNITPETYTIHHFSGSWLDPAMRRRLWRHRTVGLAMKSYRERDWKTAYRNALLGMWIDPKLIFNRGMWAMIVKSVFRHWFRGRENET